MILLGDLEYDGRVRKESLGLTRNGYHVTVVTTPNVRKELPGLDGVRTKQMLLLTRRLFPQARGLPAKYLEFVVRAAAQAIVQPADAYHAHDLPALLPAYIAARIKRARLVYDAHELWTEQGSAGSDTEYWRRLEQWFIRRVDGVITVNQSRANIMQEEYGAPRLPTVVRNCPPADSTNSNHSTKLRSFVARSGAPDPKIVLYQGGIQPARGYDELVTAVQHLNKGIAVVILGFGSPETYVEKLKQRVTDLGLTERVFFHPPVPNDEMMEYTRSADVGLVFYDDNSRNNRYCAPNKLYDYMMAGLPSVASDLPGIQEVVQKEDVGITVDSTNPRAIAGAINTLLSDGAMYQRISRHAHEAAHQRYNWESQERALVSFYHDILSPPAKTATRPI
jgi:glycosyltransferase involved in cell wall biosynthesis